MPSICRCSYIDKNDSTINSITWRRSREFDYIKYTAPDFTPSLNPKTKMATIQRGIWSPNLLLVRTVEGVVALFGVAAVYSSQGVSDVSRTSSPTGRPLPDYSSPG